jgi:hypothetical protein
MESSEKQDGQNIRKNLILSCLIRLSIAPISTIQEIDTLLKERKSSSSANPSQVSICVTEDLNMGEKIGG